MLAAGWGHATSRSRRHPVPLPRGGGRRRRPAATTSPARRAVSPARCPTAPGTCTSTGRRPTGRGSRASGTPWSTWRGRRPGWRGAWTTSPTRTGPSSPRSACTPTTRPPVGPRRRCRCSPPVTEDVEQDSAEAYGASKVGCEQDVRARAREALVIRPGLIIGPGDPSGRFSYWPERLAEGGEVLAPESPDRDTQAIDVRDLAGLDRHRRRAAADRRLRRHRPRPPPRRPGRRGGQGRRRRRHAGLGAGGLPPRARGHLLGRTPLAAAVAAGGRARDDLPRRDRQLRRRPHHPAGGRDRADTLAWLRENPDAPRTGLSRAEEQDLLDDWHTRG